MPAQISHEIAQHWEDTSVFTQGVSDSLHERERDMAAVFHSPDSWTAHVQENGLVSGPYVHGTNPYSSKINDIRVLQEHFPNRVAIKPPHDQYGTMSIYTTPELVSTAAILAGQRIEPGQFGRPTRVHNAEDYDDAPEHPHEDFYDRISSGMIVSPDDPNLSSLIKGLPPEGYVLDGSGDQELIITRAFMRSILQRTTGQIESGTRTINPERNYLPSLDSRRAYERYAAEGVQPMSNEHLQALGHIVAVARVEHLLSHS